MFASRRPRTDFLNCAAAVNQNGVARPEARFAGKQGQHHAGDIFGLRLVEEGANSILDPDIRPQELDLVSLLRQVVGGGLAPDMITSGHHDLRPAQRGELPLPYQFLWLRL
jgi:hypothetical protein